MSDVTHGVLIRSDIRKNAGRHPSVNFAYYPCHVVCSDGKLHPALFTEAAIRAALARGVAQPEDAPRPSWIARLIAYLV